jgi:phosphoglycolate phosphatase-like HAD superfamily hydrolase
MAVLQFGDLRFDADLVAFDKDGTLVDFESMWGRLAVVWVERLVASTGNKELERDLYSSLGYDPQHRRTKPQSPLAIATTGQLRAIAAGTLYRHGISWPQAEEHTVRAFDTSSLLPLADLIRPTGDVLGILERLQDAGVRVAIVTTDHRAETEETLRLMAIAHLVDHTVCGDDGLLSKPAPDMLLAACEQSNVAPIRTAVVGDTVADLLMAQRAGAGFKAAVLTGAGDPAQLKAHADVILSSVDAIAVEQQP